MNADGTDTGAAVEIRQFGCLEDNFGVLVHVPETGATIAFDVPDQGPYVAALAETGWELTDVLITHHHWDHVQGLEELKRQTGARAIGPALSRDRIEGLDDWVEDGAKITVGGLAFQAIGTPGHTLDQISWWAPDAGFAHTGDTLFSLGCGRVFEGDMEMMWTSLDRLARMLPLETQIYCGHEYTLANARFALTIDPDNAALAERVRQIEALRAAGKPTLPTTMAEELATNPFLRARDPAIQRHLGMSGADPAEVFAEIRRRKDSFR
ncbi:hydroxyacylglutathione hydrolase [Stappia taiwanensis]|uniref:Hydroxyacylglutathione hydrolase n=1 Tax=Stappia taiwanensis TaxID=992267 RepID=A0A838XXH3_9HYPH|nr:hydroxyacylglutathione hydrolase [Stappia taiwanensis]MBA4611490.1 hydroxyacylglutathione hydrolase [Stappia taiwanensis]GGE99843.1 hydroxyacylglutathione hydrolase [Stappia taiwanensis]